MELRDSRVYYGTCSTAASESEKVVEVLNPVFIDGQNNRLDLMVGDILVVKLDNGNTTSNPTIKLRVKGDNQNISVSADAGLTTLINERYDWAPQEIMAFACVYCGPINEGEDPINSYAWKPIELPIASDDTYGVTKLITNMENLVGNENQPVSYDIIQNLIGNSSGSLGLTYNNENGNLTLGTSDSKTVNIPMPRTKTSQLINDGEPRQQGEENVEDRYWSSRVNNYVMKIGLGIGYPYTESSQQKIIRSIEPYGTIKSGDKTAHAIRIGRDALKAYQNGIKPDGSDDLLEIDPHVRLYGNKIDFLIDAEGSVGIGDCNISANNNSYVRDYIFEPNKATFKQNLNITDDKKLISKYIEYNGVELENRLTKFYLKRYTTGDIVLPSNKGAKDGVDDNRTFEITGIPSGYRPIAIIGYNMNSPKWQVHYVNMWECYINPIDKASSKYYIHYGVFNYGSSEYTIKINFDVLFVKKGLVE